jgi:hypothetical protein
MRDGPAELQARWRAVAKNFRAWTLPIDLFFDPTSYRLWGADLLPGVMTGRRARDAAAALEGASAETLESLAAMAEVNARRSGDVFRSVAIMYISLPLGLAAMLSDAAPDQTRAFITEHTTGIGNIVFALAISPIVYWLGHWRAKQIAWTIALYRSGAVTPAVQKQDRR